MFKKSLVTIAALGAFAGSAFAGVTLYGTVDGGFQYSNSKLKNHDAKSAFKLAEGIGSANKFGIKGEEKISDDLAVGFKLENGFNLANGALAGAPKKATDPTRLFDREAVLYAKTVAGTIAVGREGAISSGLGMFGQFGGKVAAYSNGRGDVPGLKYVLGSTVNRYDQSLTYESPKFAGVKVLAQFANKGSQAGHGYFDSKENDLFYAVGASFENEQFYGTALVDVLDKHDKSQKDGVKVSLGGNVKFDGFQVFAAGQYFKELPLNVDSLYMSTTAATFDAAKPEALKYTLPTYKGFGLMAGVAVPVATGSLKGTLGYMNAKAVTPLTVKYPAPQGAPAVSSHADFKLNRFVVGAVYDYPLSKSTFIYSGVGATFEKYKNVDEVKNGRSFAANFGLTHNF